jgi:hypothetical protein
LLREFHPVYTGLGHRHEDLFEVRFSRLDPRWDGWVGDAVIKDSAVHRMNMPRPLADFIGPRWHAKDGSRTIEILDVAKPWHRKEFVALTTATGRSRRIGVARRLQAYRPAALELAL